jgi:hypothetical protein
LIKIKLTKSDPKKDKELKVSPLMPLRVKEIRGAMFCILAVLIYLGGELKDPRQNKRFKKVFYSTTTVFPRIYSFLNLEVIENSNN